MHIAQEQCINQVKFGLIQLVSMEQEVFLPSTIIGHVTQSCNHLVSSPDNNNNILIKKVYTELVFIFISSRLFKKKKKKKAIGVL